MGDLWAALCLVAVLEGLLLFAVPGAWKRIVAQMLEVPDRQLRIAGSVVLALGLIALYFVRAG
jgi:uncharacterized protein